MKCAVLVMLALASEASADRTKAEQYFRAGERAFRAQSFASAAESFELAYKELELPEIAFSAAQAYRRQYFVDSQPAFVKRAVELYRAYLDKVKTGGRVADASDGLAEMQRELDRLTGKGTKIGAINTEKAGTRLIVNAVVEGQDRTSMTELSLIPGADKLGAIATLDGATIKLSDPIDVTAGDHTVEVRANGYFPITLKKQVAEGQTEVAEAVLRPRPAKLVVRVEAGSRIAIDGRPAAVDSELPAGRHLVTITRRGREPVARELAVANGETRTLDLSLQQTPQRRIAKWVAIGAGGIALLSIGSAFVALHADGVMAELEAKRQREGITADELARYRKQTKARDRYVDATWGLGITAVGAVTVAGLLYWFDAKAPERAVMPAITSDGIGATVSGRF